MIFYSFFSLILSQKLKIIQSVAEYIHPEQSGACAQAESEVVNVFNVYYSWVEDETTRLPVVQALT